MSLMDIPYIYKMLGADRNYTRKSGTKIALDYAVGRGKQIILFSSKS